MVLDTQSIDKKGKPYLWYSSITRIANFLFTVMAPASLCDGLKSYQLLQALSGEGTKGEVSFPDEGEDDCDDDFLLDLDELAAAGEESFEPSALPKRTYFRRWTELLDFTSNLLNFSALPDNVSRCPGGSGSYLWMASWHSKTASCEQYKIENSASNNHF